MSNTNNRPGSNSPKRKRPTRIIFAAVAPFAISCATPETLPDNQEPLAIASPDTAPSQNEQPHDRRPTLAPIDTIIEIDPSPRNTNLALREPANATEGAERVNPLPSVQVIEINHPNADPFSGEVLSPEYIAGIGGLPTEVESTVFYGDHPDERVLIYNDAETKNNSLRPVFVFFHGGGFVAGEPEKTYEVSPAIFALAKEHGGIIYTPGYKKANEGYLFPEPYISAMKVLLYIAGETEGPIIISGASAGGTLALLLTSNLKFYDEPRIPRELLDGVIKIQDSGRLVFAAVASPPASLWPGAHESNMTSGDLPAAYLSTGVCPIVNTYYGATAHAPSDPATGGDHMPYFEALNACPANTNVSPVNVFYDPTNVTHARMFSGTNDQLYPVLELRESAVKEAIRAGVGYANYGFLVRAVGDAIRAWPHPKK